MKAFIKYLSLGVFVILIPSLTLGFVLYLNYQNRQTSTSLEKNTSKSEVLGEEISYIPSNKKESKVNLKFIQQETKNGSAIASVQMALNYFDIRTTQSELGKKLAFSEPNKPTDKKGNFIWGDPKLGFVGDLNGSLVNSADTKLVDLGNSTSLGVYNTPLRDLAKQYKQNVVAFEGSKISDIQTWVAEKKAVLLWLAYDDFYDKKVTFKTPDGKTLQAFSFKVVVVSGYKTNDEGKIIFSILDPETGRGDLDEDTLFKYWQRMDNQSLVIS